MFSNELLDKLQEEASAGGLKGATAISLAVREALMGRKERVPDNRTKTYWVAGSVVWRGSATPADGIAESQGLAQISELADGLVDEHQIAVSAQAWESQFNECRAGLTRRGYGHMQVILEKQGDLPISWVDIFVFNDAAAAQAHADSLPRGKVI